MVMVRLIEKEHTQEIYNWLIEHIGNQYSGCRLISNGFLFQKEDDAFLFKMVWG